MSEAEDIWTFAYGANMHPSVLERRKLSPLEHTTGVLQEHRLVFNAMGVPWLEPVFANVEPHPGACVHGVLWRLTCADFDVLDRYEGGGEVYSRGHGEARTQHGRLVKVVFYVAQWVLEGDERPSHRYLALMREGARIHGLDAAWCDMLDCQATLNGAMRERISLWLVDVFERLFALDVPVMPLVRGLWSIRSLRGDVRVAKCMGAVEDTTVA